MSNKIRKNITLSAESIAYLEQLAALVQDSGNLSQGIELAVAHLKEKITLDLTKLGDSNDTKSERK